MEYNICFDLCSILILLVLLFFDIYIPKFKNLQNKLFKTIIIINLFTVASDALSAGHLLVDLPDKIWLNRFVLAVYQTSQHLLAPLYYAYMLTVVYRDYVKKVIKKRLILFVPGAFICLSDILTPFTGLTFTYNEFGYQRNDFYLISVGVTVFYMLLSIGVMIWERKNLGFLPKAAVFGYTGITVAFSIIQFLYPKYLLLGTAGTISILSMYMALQNPRLIKDALEEADEARKEAENANKAKSIFLANMSHEIRTPMNAICGMTDLLEASDLNDDQKEYVDTIQLAGKNLLGIINEILDFSKVDAGKMTLNNTEYRMENVIREVQSLLVPMINTERVAPTLYFDPEIPLVMEGDPAKVRQIMHNLLSNAIKYTDNGQILLSVKSEQKTDTTVQITITVKDTGTGIREEDKAKLFAQFEQAPGSRHRMKEGTGLGLALVKSYCEMMGGRVEVESEFGSGSTFTATIIQKIVQRYPDSPKMALSKYSFVCLESNPYVAKSIERTLRSISKNVSILKDIDALKDHQFLTEKTAIVFNDKEYGDALKQYFIEKNFSLKIGLLNYSDSTPNEIGVRYARYPFSFIELWEILLKSSGINNVHDTNRSSEEEKADFDKIPKFSSRASVVVVDDNKVNLKVTKAILFKFGIEAETMTSAYELIEALEGGSEYNLVLMDHMMPELDGIEATKRIRAMKKSNTGMPIIALTANALNGVEKDFLDAGMNDFIFKPMNINILAEKLIKYIPENMRI